MKKGLRVMALLLLVLVSMTSCRRDESVQMALARAETLMESDPHAARAVLDSLENVLRRPSTLSRQPSSPRLSKSDAALYALLRTQADHKCHIRLTSDSLPLIATRYYGTRHKSQYAALAQHYLGCTYRNMHRDLDAIEAQLRATSLFPDTTNKYYANSLFQLGLLCRNQTMYDSAMVAFSRYRRTDVCHSDSVNIGIADYNMGLTALFMGDAALADSLFHCAEKNTKSSDYMRNDIYYQLAKLHFYLNHNADAALHYLDKYIRYFGETGGTLLMKADIWAERNNPSLAYKCYREGLAKTTDIYAKCSAYKGLIRTAPLVGKPDSTTFFLIQYNALLDSIYDQNKHEEIEAIKNNHIIEIHDQKLKSRHARFILLGGLFFMAVFSAFAIALLLFDRKRKNEKLKFEQELRDIKQRHIDQVVKEEEPEEETEYTSASEDEEPEVEESIPVPARFSIQQERVNLYRKQYEDSEWARYFKEHQLEIRSKKYIAPNDSAKFMAYLHELFADVFLDMVNDNQELTRQDLEYCGMVMLGFTTDQKSCCARVSAHSLHNRRYRMKDKLNAEWYAFIFGSPK